MEVTKENLLEIMNINFDGEDVCDVDIDCIVDAGLNPREVDIKYAEQIPLSAPPIVLGIIKNDEELKNKLVIIDGNHRMYSYLNVHVIKRIKAVLKTYESKADAIIDAYKFNVNHGKRLSDKEIGTGIKKIAAMLRNNEEDGKKTYTKLSELLNLPLTAIYEYIAWEKVENALGEKIEKMKAARMHFFLKQENGIELLKEFWNLNKNLSYRKLREAAKFYKETGRITDYERYKIESALLEDDEDDGIEQETIIKPTTVNNFKTEIYNKIEDDESIAEYHNCVEDQDIEEEEENETVGYKYTPSEINENDIGNPVEIIPPKRPIQKPEIEETTEEVQNDNLVSVKGLTRRLAFETVMENIFNNLQEDILSTNSLLNETIERNLHNNREEFEKHKDEYLAIVNNCKLILTKMEKVLNRANKDYRE